MYACPNESTTDELHSHPLPGATAEHPSLPGIVYLNDLPDGSGGETAFFYLGRAVAPRTGRLLTFRNVSGGGALNRRSLHAGLPVVNGSKWIVTTFLRET